MAIGDDIIGDIVTGDEDPTIPVTLEPSLPVAFNNVPTNIIAPVLDISVISPTMVRVTVMNMDLEATKVIYWCEAKSSLAGYNTIFGSGVDGALNYHDFMVSNDVYFVKARFATATEQGVDSELYEVDARQGIMNLSIEVLQTIFIDAVAGLCFDFRTGIGRNSFIPLDEKKDQFINRAMDIAIIKNVLLDAYGNIDNIRALIASAETPIEIIVLMVALSRNASLDVDWSRQDIVRDANLHAASLSPMLRAGVATVEALSPAAVERALQVSLFGAAIRTADLPAGYLAQILLNAFIPFESSGIAVSEIFSDALLEIEILSAMRWSKRTEIIYEAAIVSEKPLVVEWAITSNLFTNADLAVGVLAAAFAYAHLPVEIVGVKGEQIIMRVTLLQPSLLAEILAPSLSAEIRQPSMTAEILD